MALGDDAGTGGEVDTGLVDTGTGGADTAAGGGGQDTLAGGESLDGGTDPEWFEGLSVEGEGEAAPNRDYAKTKGWKTPDDVVKSYREVERAYRDSGRVKVPGEGATPEEITAFHKLLGVPDDPKGYEFKAPLDADGNPVELDTVLLDRIAITAHKMGIPKGALEAVVSDYVNGQIEVLADGEKELKANAEKWVKDQGARGADRVAAVKAAVRHFGLSLSEQLALRAAWGAERTMDVMAQIGEGLAEDTLMGGGTKKFGGMTGAEAQARLDQKMEDKDWTDKARVPGTAENAEYRRLNDAIGADADRKAAQEG